MSARTPGCCAEADWVCLSFVSKRPGAQNQKTISIFREGSAAMAGSETGPDGELGDSKSILLVLLALDFYYLLRVPWES
jgi:hypothetical protein